MFEYIRSLYKKEYLQRSAIDSSFILINYIELKKKKNCYSFNIRKYKNIFLPAILFNAMIQNILKQKKKKKNTITKINQSSKQILFFLFFLLTIFQKTTSDSKIISKIIVHRRRIAYSSQNGGTNNKNCWAQKEV